MPRVAHLPLAGVRPLRRMKSTKSLKLPIEIQKIQRDSRSENEPWQSVRSRTFFSYLAARPSALCLALSCWETAFLWIRGGHPLRVRVFTAAAYYALTNEELEEILNTGHEVLKV